MSYGFETYRPDTSRNLNGLSACGVFIEILTIESNNVNSSKSYPAIPAGELKFFQVFSPGHTITVDYDSSGYARVNWVSFAGSAPTVLLIFARKLNEVNTYGLTIRNDNQQVIADYSYSVPQYWGSITLATMANSTLLVQEGYSEYFYNFTIPSHSSNRIVLINLPNTGANVWYSLATCFVPAGSTPNTHLRIFAPTGSSYYVPTLHLYSLDSMSPAISEYGIQLVRGDTSLVFDSGRENLTAQDMITMVYPPIGSINTYSASTPTVAGFLPPSQYYQTTHTPVSGGWTRNRYMSAVRRMGNSFESRMMWEDTTFVTLQLAGASPGNANTFCIVTDIAYLSPGNVIGTNPPPAPSTYPSYINPPGWGVYGDNQEPYFAIGPNTTSAGPWHNGSGDPNLYEVRVTLTSGSSQHTPWWNNVNQWYSLHTEQSWAINPPDNSGESRIGNFQYQIRIKSNSQVVVTSTFTLEYSLS